METSPQFYIDIVPGAKQLRRAAEFVGNLSLLPSQVDLSLSEHIRRPEAQPGEIGGVIAVPTFLADANLAVK